MSSCWGNTQIPVKIVIHSKVFVDGSEIHQHIVELFEKEEALSHALSPWDSVALSGSRSDQLEELVSNTDVLFGVGSLADNSMHCRFENVLLRSDRF